MAIAADSVACQAKSEGRTAFGHSSQPGQLGDLGSMVLEPPYRPAQYFQRLGKPGDNRAIEVNVVGHDNKAKKQQTRVESWHGLKSSPDDATKLA
ncbi:MAG: hypothetical protein IJG84_21630 [Kiritimatiellae bacterium]|nr:hypothetical protein [Kiritimatiellia bacterium]